METAARSATAKCRISRYCSAASGATMPGRTVWPLVPCHRRTCRVVVERITQRFVKERKGNESFQDFITRIGKAESRKMLEDLMEVPAYELSPGLYSDWGDPREFTMGDMGMGECAGEVVSRLDFDLQAAERLCFEAQLKLEAKRFGQGRRVGLQIDAASGTGIGQGTLVRRAE